MLNNILKKVFFVFLCLFSTLLFSQQTDTVDFKTGKAHITIDPHKKEVRGKIVYTFEILNDIDSIFIDAQQMHFNTVTPSAKTIRFYNDGSKLWLIHPFKAKTTHHVAIGYTATPKKTMYFTGWENTDAKKQVWTQGQGKYTSNWIPSFDDVNEKVTFELDVTFHKDYEVISNGKLINTTLEDTLRTWEYRMQRPMSSYLLAVAIGKYHKKHIRSGKNVPLLLYYYPEDTLNVEPTYRHTKTLFDFLEREIGIAYPWQNYKQVPVRDFLHAGMENTSITIFSDSYVVDSMAFADRNYINVNAHELAHQWFGNFVTAKNGTHHWLQEGFSTYYALLVEREIFGEDHYYRKLYESAEQLMALSDQGKGEHVLNASASSLTFYEKGAWVLHILREKIGTEAFKKGIKSYLLKHQFSSAVTEDFITIMEKESGKDLSGFTERWLTQEAFPKKEAIQSLQKNKFLNTLLTIKEKQHCATVIPFFSAKNYYPINQEIVYKCNGTISEELVTLYQKILQSRLPKERQAVALVLDTIPPELKHDFESLLHDNSYITIEKTLYTLWENFPEDRERYLNKTKGISGFNDKNVEMLWLTLALITPDYAIQNKPEYYKKLSGYTAPLYAYEIRQNAFSYLYRLQLLSDQNLADLIDACLHRTWRFARASRSLLDALLKDPEYKNRLKGILPQLNDKMQQFLKKKITP